MTNHLKTWTMEMERARARVERYLAEQWYGSTTVRDDDDRVIAHCTTIEAADAARRLLLGR